MVIVLCQGCGMRVILQADGSCPGCGARGELSLRVWQGQEIRTLIPAKTAQAGPGREYACLYLRPFAKKFRATARMRAVARAMRPFGTTVALHAREARSPFGRAKPALGFVVGFLPVVIWNLVMVRVVDLVRQFVLRREGVELVDVNDDRWQSTFRRLAFHSRLIVMDASAATAGLDYEAEFIMDLELGRRLVLLHNGSASAHAAATQQGARLGAAGLSVRLIPYQVWRLHRLRADLWSWAEGQLQTRSGANR